MKKTLSEFADELAKATNTSSPVAIPKNGAAASAFSALKQARDAGGGALRAQHLDRAQRYIATLDPKKDQELVQHLQAQVLALGGRGKDTQIAHFTPGELVLPRRFQTPEIMAELRAAALKAGIDFASLRIGNRRNRINPKTGKPEFDAEDNDDSGFSLDLKPDNYLDDDSSFDSEANSADESEDNDTDMPPSEGDSDDALSPIPQNTAANSDTPPQQIAGSLANGRIEGIKSVIRSLAPGKFSEDDIQRIAQSFADHTSDSEAAGLAASKLFGAAPYTVDHNTGNVTLESSLYNNIQKKINQLPSDLSGPFNDAVQDAIKNGSVIIKASPARRH